MLHAETQLPGSLCCNLEAHQRPKHRCIELCLLRAYRRCNDISQSQHQAPAVRHTHSVYQMIPFRPSPTSRRAKGYCLRTDRGTKGRVRTGVRGAGGGSAGSLWVPATLCVLSSMVINLLFNCILFPMRCVFYFTRTPTGGEGSCR